jgi:cytidine deaminase
MSAEELIAEARTAAERAYAPYSGYRVGAVVVDEDGRHFAGVNVENAAYGSTICAEAGAIVCAVSAGARRLDTVAVACIDAEESGFPCGNCRQLMLEFGVKRVIIAGPRGPIDLAFEDLLPYPFRLEP